jgi:hypothetical protein
LFYNSNLAPCKGVKQGGNCAKKIYGDTTLSRLSAKGVIAYTGCGVIVLMNEKRICVVVRNFRNPQNYAGLKAATV